MHSGNRYVRQHYRLTHAEHHTDGAYNMQLLHADELEAMKEVKRLKNRLREKLIRKQDVVFEMAESKGGLQSRSVFEDIDVLSEAANNIAALMLNWRQCTHVLLEYCCSTMLNHLSCSVVIIEALSSNLTDAESKGFTVVMRHIS